MSQDQEPQKKKRKPREKTSQAEIISFRLNPINEKEKRALQIIDYWADEEHGGYNIKQLVVDRLLRDFGDKPEMFDKTPARAGLSAVFEYMEDLFEKNQSQGTDPQITELLQAMIDKIETRTQNQRRDMEALATYIEEVITTNQPNTEELSQKFSQQIEGMLTQFAADIIKQIKSGSGRFKLEDRSSNADDEDEDDQVAATFARGFMERQKRSSGG